MKENYAHQVRERLSRIDKEDIIITEYAKRRASWRYVNLQDVSNDLLGPTKLVWAEKQEIRGEERFNCYFVYSKGMVFRYILIFENGKVKIINIIKVKQRWQRALVRRRQ